jgi:hypothetical protein
MIHCLRNRVLPVHRDQYFFLDLLESYRATATIRNLRTYISTYTPVIWASICSATAATYFAQSSSQNQVLVPAPLRFNTAHSPWRSPPTQKTQLAKDPCPCDFSNASTARPAMNTTTDKVTLQQHENNSYFMTLAPSGIL